MMQWLLRGLDRLETLGNRLPHPTLLFVWLCGLILLLSALAAGLQWQAVHPVTGETVTAVNLLSLTGLTRILTETVPNFTGFAPLGTVLVAMLGIGVAERAGLLSAALRALVLVAPAWLLSFAVVVAGVLSSLAADAGYVVLIPLAAVLFQAAGRHPLAGIAAAFAGVSGGFSANLVVGPIDALLAGLSTEAVALVDPSLTVYPADNYYVLAVATGLIGVIGAWVTDAVISPRLGESRAATTVERLTPAERRGLWAVAAFLIAISALLAWALVPADGALRGSDGSVVRSPLLHGIVTLIAVVLALAGMLYGRVAGTLTRGEQWIIAMEDTMATMASYLVLMFFAAQFVAYFGWTNLGAISAIHGAGWLQGLALNPVLLLLLFILLSAGINLLVGSSSAKWAIMAPVFVPMFYLLDIHPAATQLAYRIGDSVTNIITPLMPYFPMVVVFVRRHQPDAGIGTVLSLMLPYSLALLAGWSVLLGLWLALGWALGPGVRPWL